MSQSWTVSQKPRNTALMYFNLNNTGFVTIEIVRCCGNQEHSLSPLTSGLTVSSGP